MRLQGSHKFIISVLAVIALVWVGYNGYASLRLRGVKLDVVEPGRVNILAVRPAAGYRIIVANQVAYLAEVEGDFAAGDMDPDSEDVSTKSRLPLRELLETLQGDEKALGVLVMRLNDWNDVDFASGTNVWRAEDLQKALDGDKELVAKLEGDLNVDLNGVPLGTINTKSILEGIIVDVPVRLDVTVGGKTKTLVGRAQELYQPQFCLSLEARMRDLVPSADNTSFITGVYRELAEPIIAAGTGENVRVSLTNRISQTRLDELAWKPRQVLDNTVVLLNESHLTSASYDSYEVGQGREACDVSIGLTDPGRMRLWKYSHDNKGFQLMFIVDSVALAAPKITTDLAESTVKIRRVPSKDLTADAVALINEILSENK
jgi:hypothetical protein